MSTSRRAFLKGIAATVPAVALGTAVAGTAAATVITPAPTVTSAVRVRRPGRNRRRPHVYQVTVTGTAFGVTINGRPARPVNGRPGMWQTRLVHEHTQLPVTMHGVSGAVTQVVPFQ